MIITDEMLTIAVIGNMLVMIAVAGRAEMRTGEQDLTKSNGGKKTTKSNVVKNVLTFR